MRAAFCFLGMLAVAGAFVPPAAHHHEQRQQQPHCLRLALPLHASAAQQSDEAVCSRRQALWAVASTFAAVNVGYTPALAESAKPLMDCILSVERVRQSCKQLQDDITQGEYGDLKVLVRGLVKNYRLEESLTAAYRQHAPPAQRDQARALANDSLELLDQIVTYFPERINNTTGQRIKVLDPSQAIFVTEALGAAADKLAEFERALGSEAGVTVRDVRAQLEEEARQYSSQ